MRNWTDKLISTREEQFCEFWQEILSNWKWKAYMGGKQER